MNGQDATEVVDGEHDDGPKLELEEDPGNGGREGEREGV